MAPACKVALGAKGGYTVCSGTSPEGVSMRTKLIIFIVVAVLAAAGLIAGIVAVAGADQGNPLTAISAADLLAKMAQQDQKTTSISGAVAWQNNCLLYTSPSPRD